MRYKTDPNRLEVYAETAKRRHFVGILLYDEVDDEFHFQYDHDYMRQKFAIPIGPDLPFTPKVIMSKILFGSFEDRIPSKHNPAYREYCLSQEINPDETNKIILLTSIGRRGASSFVFEPVFIPLNDTRKQLIKFRKDLQLSRWDFAKAFDLPEITIRKIENGQTKDRNILKLIDLILNVPDLALKQLEITGKYVHADVRTKLYQYFKTST